ncbi:hypothetical protein MKW98_003359 [Papaver atlanticum]|uniref:Major facilitator superfamily (MFS) profile domain-containing protein n=1 Tax=Papaver atlanticum TaxID=357466 RepID=A0AAD4XRJ3_9MAGN|nr:hypothetical protein MKW98_003359 [Papaver atlanticum]
MKKTSNLLNSDDSQTHPLLEKHVKTLDETIERYIGNFGWAQLLQAIVVSFAWVFDAQQTFISVFADAEPAWHCIDPHIESCNSTMISNLCKLPRNSWTWNEPIQTSTVSEWNLSCLGPVIAGLPTSSFFSGCLLGGLVLATLADSSLGRKNLLVISCLTMSSSTFLTAFSPNIWIYSILRFVTGFGRATIGTCSLVLSTEIVGKSRRDKVGIIGFIFFTLGFLSLPAMAYFTRGSSWRMLYILTSVPAMIYSIIVHFMIYESPRWLMVRGRKEEAINTLKSIASPDFYGTNNNILSISLSGIDISVEPEQRSTDLYSSIKMLWDKKWAFRRLTAVMVVSFGVGMMYYGIPLGVGNLASSLYLSVTLNALSELPSSLITYFLIGTLRRRSSLLFFTILSGVCSIMCVVIQEEQQGLRIGVELVSFFSVCTAFDVLLIYTLELFPTCVRNSALSMVRQALVFGGIFSPILIAAERGVDDNGLLSYGVFGLVIFVCGLFVICLPETRGGIICDTMDEEEEKAKNIISEAPNKQILVAHV